MTKKRVIDIGLIVLQNMTKKRMIDIGLIVLMMALAFAWGYQEAHAAGWAGPLAKEMRQIASSEPDRFMGALRSAVQDYAWKPGGKKEFVDLLTGALGLEGYGPGALYVQETERVRRILKSRYVGAEVDTLLEGVKDLTPLPEDEEL